MDNHASCFVVWNLWTELIAGHILRETKKQGSDVFRVQGKALVCVLLFARGGILLFHVKQSER